MDVIPSNSRDRETVTEKLAELGHHARADAQRLARVSVDAAHAVAQLDGP